MTQILRKVTVMLAALAALGLGACSDSGRNGPSGTGGGDDSDSNGSGGPFGDPIPIDNPVTDGGQECTSTEEAGGFTFEKIATWRDDATAAYSIIHDDICDFSTMGIYGNGWQLLEDSGIKVGVGPFVAACEENAYWSTVTKFGDAGHSIVNHSWTHAQITTANAPHEVAEAKAELESKIGYPMEMFIFPFDSFNAGTISAVADAGHLGARAGNRDDNDGFENPPINGADPTNDMELEFDAWPRAYSKYALFYPEDVLETHAWNAIDRGGWAIREFHNVDNDDVSEGDLGFGIWKTDYANHIKWLTEAYRKNKLWIGAPVDVLKYRHAKTACNATVSGTTIDFGTPSADCQKWHTPVSVIVTTGSDVTAVAATQDGQPVYTRKLGPNRFAITADPTLGNVEMAGCGDTTFATVESGDLPAKPSPADSVCDIDTVVGPGIGADDSGMMDDFTRGEDISLQFFPNPSQDGMRTGSWSWYPLDLLEGGVETDGSNQVLHMQGGAPTPADWAWMGITLAFLGGNGAGACYDVKNYTGIEFKVKGSVTAVDDPSTTWNKDQTEETALANKLVVCLVTAETQTIKFGGDLADDKDGDGDIAGGHFCMNQGVDISSSWSTVKLPFSGFLPPTWGDTIGLTSLATAKMQAIDFGVVNTASDVDLYFDDIKLY